MYKALVFDMDGTIANLYGVSDWLTLLRAENVLPYEIARPLVNMYNLTEILNVFKGLGWTIVVNSWTAMNGSDEYNRAVRKAKVEWLKSNGFPYDELHITKYGITKANATRKKGGYQILIDDNDNIRKGWSLGDTIDPTKNLLGQLVDLLEREVM